MRIGVKILFVIIFWFAFNTNFAISIFLKYLFVVCINFFLGFASFFFLPNLFKSISDFLKQIVIIILCFLIAIFSSIGMTELYFTYLLISYILGCILQLFINLKERKQ